MPYWKPISDEEARCADVPCDTWVQPFVSPGAGQWFAERPYGETLGIPAVHRAVSLLTGAVVQMSLKAYAPYDSGSPALLNPQPFLCTNPSPPQTRSSVFSSLFMDYLLNGNAIAVVVDRDPDTTWPTAIMPVPARWVEITVDRSTGFVWYKIGDDLYAPQDVIHVKGLCSPGHLRGMAILEAACRTFRTAESELTQAANLSESGVPTGLLSATSPDVTQAELVAAKQGWVDNQRRRTVAALGPGVTFTPLSWSPDDMQLIEARSRSTQDIAMLFGVPLRYFGEAVGGLSYSNPGSDSADLLKFALDQHLIRFEEAFELQTPGAELCFDRKAISQADPAGQMALAAQGVSAGLISIDEGRAMIGYYTPLTAPAPVPVPVDDNEDDPIDDALGDFTDEGGTDGIPFAFGL